LLGQILFDAHVAEEDFEVAARFENKRLFLGSISLEFVPEGRKPGSFPGRGIRTSFQIAPPISCAAPC
jgi:hypothetical protein